MLVTIMMATMMMIMIIIIIMILLPPVPAMKIPCVKRKVNKRLTYRRDSARCGCRSPQPKSII